MAAERDPIEDLSRRMAELERGRDPGDFLRELAVELGMETQWGPDEGPAVEPGMESPLGPDEDPARAVIAALDDELDGD